MHKALPALIALMLITGSVSAASPAVDSLLQQYQAESAQAPDPAAGKALWTQTFTSTKSPTDRSCASCHTADPRHLGKHVRTGKPIKPLAPSVNPSRLSDKKEISKWLRRNCNWTLGRQCSAGEKANLLTYLKDL